jgi:hypothetical protein
VNLQYFRSSWCTAIHNSTPFWIIRIPYSCFNERCQVFHPHKTEYRFVDLCILIFKFRREITTSTFIDVKERSFAFSYFLRRYVKFTIHLTSTFRCTLRVTHRFEKPVLDMKCFWLQTTGSEYHAFGISSFSSFWS